MNLKFKMVVVGVRRFLALRSKFSLQRTSKDINIPKLFAKIRPAINRVHVFSRDVLLARVSNVINNFLHNHRHKTHPLVRLSFRTKSFLKDNPRRLGIKV